MTTDIKHHRHIKRSIGVFCAIIFWLGVCGQAHAIPSLARQTGMACTACHTQAFGVALNPYGRQFKLNGYTWGGGDQSYLSKFSGMIQGSLTNTKTDDYKFDPNSSNYSSYYGNRGYNYNNNLALDQASIFYGGKVFGPMGAFVQSTYNGVTNAFSLDNSDIRLSDEQELLGQAVVYGVSFNNNPTVQDLWNTTPNWGFPYVKSSLNNTPSAAPMISSLSGVGGATLYGQFADVLYLEAGGYSNFDKNTLKGMGRWPITSKVDGGAPYWRIALQKEWQGHYFSIGHFGMRANIKPDIEQPGSDRYTDLGMDFNYQYLADTKNIFEFKANYIREQQELFATYNNGGADQLNQQLSFMGLNGSYTYDQTYTLLVALNQINGPADSLVYSGNSNFRPNSEYYTFELDYVPFGKTAGTGLSTYMNLRFALQYVAYTQFNGAGTYYNATPDTNGLNRNASDNNTLYLNGWLIF